MSSIKPREVGQNGRIPSLSTTKNTTKAATSRRGKSHDSCQRTCERDSGSCAMAGRRPESMTHFRQTRQHGNIFWQENGKRNWWEPQRDERDKEGEIRISPAEVK